MNTYLAIYGHRRAEIKADALWPAVRLARAELKVPKSRQGLLSVVLIEKGGEQVYQSTQFIGE